MNEVTKELISNFQFTAIVFMMGLTALLCMMRMRRAGLNRVIDTTRWLMAGGTAVLALQFVLQYILKLRDVGETQALMLNLMLFAPASWLLNIAVLQLQRQGKLSKTERYAGGFVALVITVLLVVASIENGGSFFCDTPLMRTMEKVGAVLYFFSQIYYIYKELNELAKLRRSMNNYFDQDRSVMLRWMRVCIYLMAAIALFVPLAITISGKVLFLFGFLMLAGVSYLVVCFRDYVISKRAYMVMEAQQNEEEADAENVSVVPISEKERKRIDKVVSRWLTTERYLQSGITMPAIAREMGISPQLLRNWFPLAGYDSYSDWMQHLRIDHAKEMISEHPDFSVEYIANACGFRNRSYFHTVFRQMTGLTPAQFVERAKEK